MSDRKPCAVDGCDTISYKRDWCNPHYIRWRRYGDPTGLPPQPSVETRFWQKVAKTETCWLWIAYLDLHGYGKFKAKGKSVSAHSYAYNSLIGHVPSGHELDHQCHNRACVNPDHLRLVTHKQNLENRRGAPKSNKTSGVRGVSWDSARSRWHAHVGHNGRQIALGRFRTIAEAEAAVVAKRIELFTHNDLDRYAAS